MKKLFVIFLFLSSCSTIVSPSAQMGEAVNFKVSESVTFTNDLTVKFVTPNESRCPKNVQCVRWGELGATFSLSYKGETKEVTYCVDGECVGNTNAAVKYLLSGTKVSVGGKDFAISIIDFTPKEAEVNVTTGTNYSIKIKVSE